MRGIGYARSRGEGTMSGDRTVLEIPLRHDSYQLELLVDALQLWAAIGRRPDAPEALARTAAQADRMSRDLAAELDVPSEHLLLDGDPAERLAVLFRPESPEHYKNWGMRAPVIIAAPAVSWPWPFTSKTLSLSISALELWAEIGGQPGIGPEGPIQAADCEAFARRMRAWAQHAAALIDAELRASLATRFRPGGPGWT